MLTSLVISCALALGPAKLLGDPQAQRAFDEAQKAFEAKDYATASEQLERAYMLEPEAALLYPWAQAERNLGRCESAIDLYQKFIDSGPNERMAAAAQQNIERCQETLAAAQPDEPPPPPPPGSDDEPPPPRVDAPAPTDRDAGPKPVGRDVVGGVLVGVGAAAAITGAALLGIASKQAKGTADANDNSTYLDMRAQAGKLQAGGIAALAVGGALIVAGAVRYGLLARKRKADVALWWHGGGAGLALSSRF